MANAVYQNLRIRSVTDYTKTTTSTSNPIVTSPGSTGYKSITLTEGFMETTDNSATKNAAARVAVLKADPRAALAMIGNEISAANAATAKDASNFPNNTLTLESWNITEKTRVYQVEVNVDKDGKETTDESKIVGKAKKTRTSTHAILTFTIKIQDFWVVP